MIKILKRAFEGKESFFSENSITVHKKDGDGADEYFLGADVPWVRYDLFIGVEKASSLTLWESGLSRWEIAVLKDDELNTVLDETKTVTEEKLAKEIDEFLHFFVTA